MPPSISLSLSRIASFSSCSVCAFFSPTRRARGKGGGYDENVSSQLFHYENEKTKHSRSLFSRVFVCLGLLHHHAAGTGRAPYSRDSVASGRLPTMQARGVEGDPEVEENTNLLNALDDRRVNPSVSKGDRVRRRLSLCLFLHIAGVAIVTQVYPRVSTYHFFRACVPAVRVSIHQRAPYEGVERCYDHTSVGCTRLKGHEADCFSETHAPAFLSPRIMMS